MKDYLQPNIVQQEQVNYSDWFVDLGIEDVVLQGKLRAAVSHIAQLNIDLLPSSMSIVNVLALLNHDMDLLIVGILYLPYTQELLSDDFITQQFGENIWSCCVVSLL